MPKRKSCNNDFAWVLYVVHGIGQFLTQKDYAAFVSCCKASHAFSLSELKYRFCDLCATDVLVRDYQNLTLVRCEPMICSRKLKSLRFEDPPCRSLTKIPQTVQSLSFKFPKDKDGPCVPFFKNLLNLLPSGLKSFEYENEHEYDRISHARLSLFVWPPTLTCLKLNFNLTVSNNVVVTRSFFPQSLRFLHLCLTTPLCYPYDQLTNLETLYLYADYPDQNTLLCLPHNLLRFYYFFKDGLECLWSDYIQKDIPTQLLDLGCDFRINVMLPPQLQILDCAVVTNNIALPSSLLGIKFSSISCHDILSFSYLANLTRLTLEFDLTDWQSKEKIALPATVTTICIELQYLKFFVWEYLESITLIDYYSANDDDTDYNLDLLANVPRLKNVRFPTEDDWYYPFTKIVRIIGLYTMKTIPSVKLDCCCVYDIEKNKSIFKIDYKCASCAQVVTTPSTQMEQVSSCVHCKVALCQSCKKVTWMCLSCQKTMYKNQ